MIECSLIERMTGYCGKIESRTGARATWMRAAEGRFMSGQETAQNVLGKRLKEEREYRGFSQEEVAGHLGVPWSAVSLMESGSRRVSADPPAGARRHRALGHGP